MVGATLCFIFCKCCVWISRARGRDALLTQVPGARAATAQQQVRSPLFPRTTSCCPPSFRTSRAAISYGASSDVWAAGVIMAELLALAPLFPGDARLQPPTFTDCTVAVTLCPVPARLVGVRPTLSHRWGVSHYMPVPPPCHYYSHDCFPGSRSSARLGRWNSSCRCGWCVQSLVKVVVRHHRNSVTRPNCSAHLDDCAFCPEVHSSDIVWQACRCRLSLRHRSSACFRRLLLRLPC
jgi:hypothetical protein